MLTTFYLSKNDHRWVTFTSLKAINSDLLMLLLLLLTPDEVLKKTENRILLSISGLGPSTNGKDLEKKEKCGKLENSNKKQKNTDEK